MKLLFVHRNLGEFGGAEANIRITARELTARGHSCSLLYHTPTGRNEQDWRETFYQCLALPPGAEAPKVQSALKRLGPDLIYLHNVPSLTVVQALLDSPIPVVRMVHDHSLYCMRTYKYNYFTRRICTRPFSLYCLFPCLASVARGAPGSSGFRWVSYRQKRRELQLNRRCAFLIVYSDYVKRELVGNGFDSRRIMLCAPIPIPSSPVPTSSFNDQNLILFAGQIIRGKGVDALLESLAKVHTQFRCSILGQGNHLRNCLDLCARLGLSERVKFHGYVLPGQLQSFYLQASVFAMSSLWPEPFGMAGPEAMRYGLPVVAFDAGGISEWLTNGQNGFIVPWRDTTQFARRLEELLRNKELARHMGGQALEMVRRFDASRQIHLLEQVFRQAAQHNGTDPIAKPQMLMRAGPGHC